MLAAFPMLKSDIICIMDLVLTHCQGASFSQATTTMTIRASKFTPKVLLEAPRRSEGAPNSGASQILYSVSTYSFSEHAKKGEIRILDVESQQASLVTDDKSYSEPTWLDDKAMLLLNSKDDGTTNIVIGSPHNFEKRYVVNIRNINMFVNS